MRWLSGTGEPEVSEGQPGDFYLNESNGDIYANENGTWNQKANIQGPQGDRGQRGQTGASGADGATNASELSISSIDGLDASNVQDALEELAAQLTGGEE